MTEIRDRIRELRRVPAGELVPNPDNWRRHPKRQRSALRAMLEQVGYADALLARTDADGRLVLIDGHLRAETTPDQEVPVLVLDVDEHEAAQILATLDPLAAMADADRGALDALLEEAAIDDDDLERYLRGMAGPRPRDRTEADAVPATIDARAKPGDVWALGPHRITCGDSTDADVWAALMGDRRAQVVFTDPPYGEGITARSLSVTGGRHKPIENDALERDQLVGLVAGALTRAAEHARDDAAFYVWHAATTQADFHYALTAAGLQVNQVIIWAKPGAPPSWADYLWAHEPCYYASKAGHRAAWHGLQNETTIWRVGVVDANGIATALGPGLFVTDGRGHELYLAPKGPKTRRIRHQRLDDEPIRIAAGDEGTVWEVSRDASTPEHPTQKPVELGRRAIENSCRRGELITDPFLGSGSTLMGAEVTGRICFGIELDPHYVDVAIARWEAFTGQQATKE